MTRKLTFLILALFALIAGPGWGQMRETKTLTFALTSNPGEWPTDNPTTLTNYTYTLDGTAYTFALKNVKCNSGYLMMTSTAVLGLPAIEDYKLTKVVAKNSGGCSTSTKVGISSSATSADYITGGNAQTWSTTSSTYTYNLSGTVENTVYYMYVTNKNAQVIELALTYESTTPSTDPSITVNPSTITWDNSPINVQLSETISVSQANLTSDITITSTIGNVSPSTITVGEDATDVILTYTPTTTGDFEGEITFTSGETTATVSVTGSAYDPSQVDTYTKVNSIADLTADDVFIIVGNNGSNYAMSNNNGTSSAPTAVAVTVTDDVITNPANTILWTISGNATDGYIFYPYGSTTTWLYCTDANNGLRVGNTTDSQDHRTFSIKDSYIFNNSRNRYLGIYSNSDWRSYTSINTNITGQTFAFYKKGGTPSTVATPTFTPAAGTYTEAQNVTIACETEGASIYYTLDGSTPTNASTLYTSAIAVSETTTVKAIAYVGEESSNVATATYTIVAPLTSITVTGTAADLWKGDAFSHEGITVTANWGDNTQTDVTNDATYSGYDMNTAGEQTVTVTYMEKTASYNVTVQTIANTQATAYTIAQAIAIIDAGKDLNSEVYVAGTISQLDENNNAPQYKNLTYWITDESSETEFEVFRGRNLNNTDFNSNNDIEIGADVIVFGKIAKYQSTYEFSQGNYLVSYTAPQVDKYDINLNHNEYGTISADLATASAGQTVTLTATPIEHYHFVEWTVLDGDANEVPVTNNQFVMPASDVEVEATFEEDESVVFTYHYNGEEYLDGIDYEGTVITLEEDPELSPVGFSFVGWSTSIASTDVIVNTTYTLSEDVDFYAVFEKASTSRENDEVSFVKVTEAPEDWSGEYLLVYEGGESNGSPVPAVAWTGVDAGGCGAEVSITSNTITGKPEAAATLTIAPMEGGYSIMVNGGDKDGQYIGKSNYDNGLNFAGTAQLNTLAITDGEAVITAEGKCTMRYNYASGDNNLRFRYYKSGQQPVQLYKKSGSASGAIGRYTRVYDDVYSFEGGDLTVEGPSIVVSGYTLNVSGDMINTNPTLLIIEDGAQLFQNSSYVMATFQKNITGYTGDNDNYYLIANPTANAVGEEDEYDALDGCTTFDLYTFDPTAELEWVNIGQTAQKVTFDRNVGYLYANAQDMTLHFRGYLLPTNETTNINLVYYTGGEASREFPGFNLIGNPYTCNAYVNGYNFYTMADGEFVINEGSATIAPCEGFFVEATEANQSVTVSTAAPVTAPNALSLNVSQNRGNVIDRAIVNFNGSNNLHKFMMNPAHTNLSIAKGGETFAAISTEAEGELPVNFKAEKNGTYTITVNTKNVDAEYLHLIDNMTGMDVDLLSTPSYTFEAKTSDYASRFKLVFGVNNTASESSDSNFAFMSDGNLVISDIEGEATLQIVDELGRIISTETVSGSYNKALNLKAGLYIINLNGMTQKIVVE